MLGWLRRLWCGPDDNDEALWDPPTRRVPPPPIRYRDDIITMPEPPRPGAWLNDLGPEAVSELASRVMWSRETILWLLHQVASHRWDGHDCPVYCTPPLLDMFLAQCTAADLRLLVMTYTKDSVHMAVRESFEDVDDEPEPGAQIP